jgi:hypothetical protein
MKSSLLLIAVSFSSSTAFSPFPRVHTSHRQCTNHILKIRGGDMMASSTTLSTSLAPVTEALVSGSSLGAVGALYAVASLTVVPLTLFRQAYSFSVGEL